MKEIEFPIRQFILDLKKVQEQQHEKPAEKNRQLKNLIDEADLYLKTLEEMEDKPLPVDRAGRIMVDEHGNKIPIEDRVSDE